MGIVRHIPNTITSMNLLCGVLGVIYTFEGSYTTAFCLMLAAAVCDFCDGLSARLLNAYSDMGKELDSLADIVSFGVLPSVMMYSLMIDGHGDSWICHVPLLIAVFSGLRLAKFNIDERQGENFIGLATPACAMICGSFAYYVSINPESTLSIWAQGRYFIPFASAVLCALLVSEIPMFSMKFKKGASKRLNTMRGIFLASAAIIAVVTAILGLNWSFVILTVFLVYILMNFTAALLKIRL